MPQIKYQQEEWLTSLGAKYTPNFLPFIHFMGGYKTLLTVTQSRKTNATVGMGLSLGNISVYYAYERSDYVLNDHKSYVSITSNF